MRRRFFAFAAAMAAWCSVAGSSFGQYPVIPAYRMPNQPGFAPGMMAPAGAYGQPIFAPGMVPAVPGMQAVPIVTPAAGSFVAPASFGGGPSCEVSCVAGGCEARGCDSRCESGCADCCSSDGGYTHCWHYYGEVMYLRARDAEITWGAPIDGPIVPGPINNNPIPITELGVADMDFQTGWRGGFQYNFNECSGFSAQYTMFESSTNDDVVVTVPNVVRSFVSHPGTQTAAQDFLIGNVAYNIDYDLLDFDFRKLLMYDADYRFGMLAGVGFVQMEQNFLADFAGTGTEQVETDIDFYGAGGRFGLFGEIGMTCTWQVYGRGTGSLIGGEIRADYDQRQSYDPQVVDTSWRAGRIIGIWDLELGLKRTSRCGNYAVNFGYVFSAWTNTLQTDEWIRAVRTNGFVDMDSTMTFDGLVGRFEARF